MAQSLYEKYGGFATISRIVLDFYERALDSDEIGHHFESIDMKKLIDHQTKFIASLMGGPASYSDDRLRQIHAHLNITNEEFSVMSDMLEETLIDHEFTPADAKQISLRIEARRGAIVN